MKLLIISLVLLSALTACALAPQQSQHSVDHYSLVHSAVYTQRELINIQLDTGSNKSTSQRQLMSGREQLLVDSYCDLIDRRIIYSSGKPETCGPGNAQIRQCLGEFHRCFKTCDLRSQGCRRCETPALSCLDPGNRAQY